jgi:hypothetical protein
LRQTIEQRVEALAQRIPGYVGYAAREQRREVDRQVRARLAHVLRVERDRLAAMQTKLAAGRLGRLADLQRLEQRLAYLTDRLETAAYGYGGWFEQPTIREADLDRLIEYDESLADSTQAVGVAITSLEGEGAEPSETTLSLVEHALADLAGRLDRRAELLSAELGQRAALGEALTAPSGQVPVSDRLARVAVDDGLSLGGVDYLVDAAVESEQERMLRLKNGGETWLLIDTAEVALLSPTLLDVGLPPPQRLTRDGVEYEQLAARRLSVRISGPGGQRTGSIRRWVYAVPDGQRLVIDDWGDGDVRAYVGRILAADEIEHWPKRR